MIEGFRLERVSRNPAVFDEQKLRWMNGRYLRELPLDELTRRLEQFTGRTGIAGAVAIAQDKMQTLADFEPLCAFIFDGPADDPAAFDKVIGEDGGAENLVAARAALAATEPFDQEHVEAALRGVVERARGQAAPGLPAAARGAGRQHGLAGHLRDRRPARPRRDPAPGRRGAREDDCLGARTTRKYGASQDARSKPGLPGCRYTGRVEPIAADAGPKPRERCRVAAPQRRPRTAPDGGVRGARGVSRRWPSPANGSCACSGRSGRRPRPWSRRSRPTSRWPSRSCAWPTTSRAPGAHRWTTWSRRSRSSRPSPCRPSSAAPAPSTSSSAPACGTPRPSASACTPSPPSTPPRSSRPSATTSTATGSWSPRCCTTWASSCSSTPTRAIRPRSTATPARPRSACAASVASSASTTPWSAACSRGAGACPRSIASTIERHHAEDASGEAAFVRLADMLAHYAQGSAVSPAELLRTARTIGMGAVELRAVMYDMPYPTAGRARHIDPCPLSDRELDVLRRLGEGKVYKQIAHELDPLDQHRAHASAQHLREARRGRPRPGRSAGHRARLALTERRIGSAVIAAA